MQAKPPILLTKLKLLQHIYDQQLPHLCVVHTGLHSEPLFQWFESLYRHIGDCGITHRLAISSSIQSLNDQVLPFAASLGKLTGKDREWSRSTGYLVVCGPADFAPGIRSTVASSFQGSQTYLDVFYLFVASDQNRVRTLASELATLEVERKAKMLNRGVSLTKYEIKGASTKQTVCLYWDAQLVTALAQINWYMQSTIPQQSQLMRSRAKPAGPFLSVTPQNATRLTRLQDCWQKVMQVASECAQDSHKRQELTASFLSLLDCFCQAHSPTLKSLRTYFQVESAIDSIDWIVENPVVLEMARTLMSASADFQTVGYLTIMFWAFYSYQQHHSSEGAGSHYTVYTSISEDQVSDPSSLLITKCWVMFSTDKPEVSGGTIICLNIKLDCSNQKEVIVCRQTNRKAINLFVPPLSVLKAQQQDKYCLNVQWVGNWRDPAVKILINIPSVISPGKKCSLNAAQARYYQKMVKDHLSIGEILRTPYPVMEKKVIKYDDQNGSDGRSWDKVFGKLGSLYKLQGRYRQSITCFRLAKVLLSRKLETNRQVAKSLLEIDEESSQREVSSYLAFCIELSDLYKSVGYHHHSLGILQEGLLHMQADRQLGSKQFDKSDEINMASIKMMAKYAESLGYTKAFDIANQIMDNLLDSFSSNMNKNQLCRELFRTKCTLLELERVASSSDQHRNASNLAEQISIYEKIVALSDGSEQETRNNAMKLAECCFEAGSYNKCKETLEKFIVAGFAEVPKLFGVRCKLQLILCQNQKQNYEQCIRLYEEVISDLDQIAIEFSEAADEEDWRVGQFLKLSQDVHLRYSNFLNKLGRVNEAAGQQTQYLQWRAPSIEPMDVGCFFPSHSNQTLISKWEYLL